MEYVIKYLLTKIDRYMITIYEYTYRKMSAGNDEFTAEFFDKSSNEWMKNKIRRGESMAYKCSEICKDNQQCTRASVGFLQHYCKQHLKINRKHGNYRDKQSKYEY